MRKVLLIAGIGFALAGIVHYLIYSDSIGDIIVPCAIGGILLFARKYVK